MSSPPLKRYLFKYDRHKRRIEQRGRMDPGCTNMLTYDRVVRITNNFSEENYFGIYQFGKIYRGEYQWMPFHYTGAMVKIWEVSETCKGANLVRAMNEVILLQHERMIEQPGMIEYYGFCWDGEHLMVVYDFDPLDSVHNLVPMDTFTWLQRIKVALGFARLLKFFHAGTSKFLVRNIGATHILVDEEYNPKLCDYSMMVGGIFPNETMYECNGCYGYVDPSIGLSGTSWSDKTDVFAFGVLLLNLITKKIDTQEDKPSSEPLLYVWAWDQFDSCESTLSLVDQSLASDSSFSFNDGCKITNLAMKCVNRVANERLTMKQVVKCLFKLEVVKVNAEFLGLTPIDDKLTTDIVA